MICTAKEDSEVQENKQDEGVSCFTNNENSVLLQTAKTQVKNFDNKNTQNVRWLLDSGSQMSYVTPRLAKLLGLKTLHKKEMCIKTFGGGRQTKTLDVVELSIKALEGYVSIQEFISEISYPIKGQDIAFAIIHHFRRVDSPDFICIHWDKSKYNHLKGLKLADYNSTDPIDVDVLIGSDHYWTLIDGKDVRKG